MEYSYSRHPELRRPSIDYDEDGVAFVEKNGRRSAFEIFGDSQGEPVFFLHGMPGSRIGHYFMPEQLSDIKLICNDRPGYGKSTRREGRTVVSAVEEVQAIADALGLGTFGVMGRSGGGPYALACAATLQDRISNVVVLNGVAPMHEMGPAWFEGMAESNVRAFGATDDETVVCDIEERAAAIQQDPTSLIAHRKPEFNSADQSFEDFARLAMLFEASHTEAVAQGPGGWVDDVLAQRKLWGFDLSSIRTPVHFQYGWGDQFVPSQQGLWMQSRIPGSTIDVVDDLSHFDPCPELLRKFVK